MANQRAETHMDCKTVCVRELVVSFASSSVGNVDVEHLQYLEYSTVPIEYSSGQFCGRCFCLLQVVCCEIITFVA